MVRTSCGFNYDISFVSDVWARANIRDPRFYLGFWKPHGSSMLFCMLKGIGSVRRAQHLLNNVPANQEVVGASIMY